MCLGSLIFVIYFTIMQKRIVLCTCLLYVLNIINEIHLLLNSVQCKGCDGFISGLLPWLYFVILSARSEYEKSRWYNKVQK